MDPVSKGCHEVSDRNICLCVPEQLNVLSYCCFAPVRIMLPEDLLQTITDLVPIEQREQQLAIDINDN
jgi:hypothetical protein